ncbi:MAG: hypothetical protein Q8M71_10520 [Thermodesulfovibrionales bacterium]|nr:hypothetical protein [Thermodesulfovibrionales bacterium]
MKVIISLLFAAALFIFGGNVEACVGKVISIGILNSLDEQILAEMLSVLINERTGTSVQIKYYKDSKEIYSAVRKGEIGILIENSDRALEVLGMPKSNDAKKAFDIAKEEFSMKFNLVWLSPFGLLTGDEGNSRCYYSTLITNDVVHNFPALPRLVNKLGGIMDDEIFARMLKNVKSGEKPRKIARDFLKTKKLI